MIGLGAGVGLHAHKCVKCNVNKIVVTVYIEKSHPNIYAIMAILLPKKISHDDKIHNAFRICILTPKVSYLKQWRTLYVEKKRC